MYFFRLKEKIKLYNILQIICNIEHIIIYSRNKDFKR